MLKRRLDQEIHGSAGYTSARRLVALGILLVMALVGSHLALRVWYDGRILPGVKVAGIDFGGKTISQTRSALADAARDYRLQLTVGQSSYELAAADVGVTFDVESTVASAYNSGRDKAWSTWHHEPVAMAYQLDRKVLRTFAETAARKVGTAPVDAAIVMKNGVPVKVPEKSGWSIDKVGLVRLIEQDIQQPGGVNLALQPREQVAQVLAARLDPAVNQAQELVRIPVVVKFADKTFVPSVTDIGSWLTFVKASETAGTSLVPTVDESKVKNYVLAVANQLDIAPINKKITIENGVSRVDQEGVDGMAINQDEAVTAIMTGLTAGQSVAVQLTTRPVAFKTISTNLITLDYPRYIEVNISKQRLWVWQDKAVIYETPVTTGATGAGFGTAQGLFSVYYKTTNTRLRGYQYGYDYDVAVKYWMPFYQGYGLHDASWRNGKFGGSDYYYGGSHGCVNLPDAAAEFVYNWATVGTPVWVHK